MKTHQSICFVLFGWLCGCTQLYGESLKVAVAANFAPTLETIRELFTAETGQQLKLSVASTGTLYAQIIHGAPYHVFLAADRERPLKLEQQGLTEARFTYATGRLALWAPGSSPSVDASWLKNWRGRLAIANPRLAPYGAAAAEVLERLDAHPGELITGNNVAQAFGFIESGNVPAGFVALAQLIQFRQDREQIRDDYWLVPAAYHSPIEQQAVIIKNAHDSATDFAAFLRSDAVHGIIKANGYDLTRP